MSWMGTQLYSGVASRPTRSRRVASLSVARLQSAGAGSDLETKRSALGAHPSVRTYVPVDYSTAAAATVSHIAKYFQISGTKCQDRLPLRSALGMFFVARPEAVSVGLGA